MSNTNCLAGVRCPRCRQADHFHIESRVTCFVTDDGAEPGGDLDWDAASYCICPECGHGGPLDAFRDTLPPDAQGLNDDRASWAETALAAFASETGGERADAVADLLCDLMHWCDRNDRSFADELERAKRHYAAETGAADV
jgi:hypothetical protein